MQLSVPLPLPRIRTRAMLCHIYHHSIHDRWYQARDLMLMSHLQEAIQFADVLTMVSALHMLSGQQNGNYKNACTVPCGIR